MLIKVATYRTYQYFHFDTHASYFFSNEILTNGAYNLQ